MFVELNKILSSTAPSKHAAPTHTYTLMQLFLTITTSSYAFTAKNAAKQSTVRVLLCVSVAKQAVKQLTVSACLCGSVAIILAALVLTPPPGIASANEADYTREIVTVPLPDVVLLNQKGKRVRLTSFLTSDKPLVVDFIYATCTTICPILSAGIVNIQKKFAAQNQEIQLVSITIDPENDTPKIMHQYLKRYHAKPGWDFLTGSRTDIDKVMESFDAYFSDKMSHLPLYFIKTAEKGKWVRIEGFIDGDSFKEEIDKEKF